MREVWINEIGNDWSFTIQIPTPQGDQDQPPFGDAEIEGFVDALNRAFGPGRAELQPPT